MLNTRCDMEEIWIPIPGYEGYYEVSNNGRIRSIDRKIEVKNKGTSYWVQLRGRLMRPHHSRGYLVIALCRGGVSRTVPVHKCVCKSFIHNPDGLNEINHKNGDREDNRVENLEWCTRQYNIRHSYYVNKRKPSGCKPVLCLETGKVYPSCMAAGRALNINNSSIADVAKGIYKQMKGYHFVFADQINPRTGKRYAQYSLV